MFFCGIEGLDAGLVLLCVELALSEGEESREGLRIKL